MTKKTIRIGTQTNALALAQTQCVIDSLAGFYPEHRFQMVGISSAEEQEINEVLTASQERVFSTKKLEKALLDQMVDLAVHSLSDLPPVLTEGLSLGLVGWREEIHDVLVSLSGYTIHSLPRQAKVGVDSAAKRAQLLRLRQDMDVIFLPDSIENQLQRLETGRYEAIILAGADLKRLQITKYPRTNLSVELFLPAPGQGALAVEIRMDDSAMGKLLSPWQDTAIQAAIQAERALMAQLAEECDAPMAALGSVRGGVLTLQGAVFSPDGSRYYDLTLSGRLEEAEHLGFQLGLVLLEHGARGLRLTD